MCRKKKFDINSTSIIKGYDSKKSWPRQGVQPI